VTVDARDLPGARSRRLVYHGVVGLIALLASWNAFGWNARAREAAATVSEARERLAAEKAAADGVAAECGLRPFSDDKSLEKFPMALPAYPTKRESACLQKVTDARAALINTRLDYDKSVPIEQETGAVARGRFKVAAALGAIFLAGVYAIEIHRGFRGRGSAKGA
jgi:hypothetical protein